MKHYTCSNCCKYRNFVFAYIFIKHCNADVHVITKVGCFYAEEEVEYAAVEER